MDTELLVSEISPARNALLLLESFHDTVPWMNVSYKAREYSSACSVCGLLITTLLSASTVLPPNAHSIQWQKVAASLGDLPRQKPAGWPIFFSPWHSLRKPSVSVGNLSKPACFIHEIR